MRISHYTEKMEETGSSLGSPVFCIRTLIRPVGTKDRWDPPFLPHLTAIGFVSLLTQRVQFVPRHLNLPSDLGLATVIFSVVNPAAQIYGAGVCVRHRRNAVHHAKVIHRAMGSVSDCDDFPMESSDVTLE